MRVGNTTAVNSLNVTVNMLAQLLCGVVATTTVLGYYESNSFRLRRVQVWSNSVTSQVTTINIQYGTGISGASQPMFGGPPNAVTATVSSPSKYAYVDLRPAKDTNWQNSWWSVVSSNTGVVLVFNSIPDESTIQFDYDTFQDSWGSRTVSPTALAGAVAGTWYSSVGGGWPGGFTPQGINYV
jgi:hypothetical protein